LKVPLHRRRLSGGFSLLELLTVIVIMGVLISLSLSLFRTGGSSPRRTAADQFSAAVEQARTAAITTRRIVLLAVAAPIDNTPGERCRIGIFAVDTLPDGETEIKADQLYRWDILPDGVVFMPGAVKSVRNVMDEKPVKLVWKDGAASAQVHVFAFNSRGGLNWPLGSDPVSVKITSGHYNNGQPVAVPGGGTSSFRVGRVVARPWNLDA